MRRRACGWCAHSVDAYSSNRKYCNEDCRRLAWKAANQHYKNRYNGKWAKANPHHGRRYAQERRARLARNPGSVGVSSRDWERLVRRYRHRCAYCDIATPDPDMDHVIPISKGGRHAIGNVIPSCERCNKSKHVMLLAVWRYRYNRRKELSNVQR